MHLEECVGRQLTKCHQCKILYPTFLIDEHLSVCNTFNEDAPNASSVNFKSVVPPKEFDPEDAYDLE
jgi:hypothetical protein